MDDRLTQGFEAPEMPVSFIFSHPRAASTLYMQLALSSLKIGYADNTLARFPKAPYLGALLAKDIRDPDYVSNFKSEFGIAPGAQEPHEWGWFWRYWLKLGKDRSFCADGVDIDGTGLRAKFGALESAMEAPLLFDNVFAMNNFEVVREILPKVLVVSIERDPYFICNSLINARIKRHGHIGVFYGNETRDIDEILAIEDPVEQIVAQVRSTRDEIAARLAALPSSRVLKVDYLEIIENPWGCMDKLAGFISGHGGKIARRDALPEVALTNRNSPALIRPEYKDRLDRHFKAYF